MKKPGVVKKGGGEVSVGGGGVGLPAGDKILLSGTGDSRKKFLLLLPGLEWVTFQVAFLIQMIQNGSNFFCDVASFFSQTEPHAGGSMEKEESDNKEAAEEAVDLCSEKKIKLKMKNNFGTYVPSSSNFSGTESYAVSRRNSRAQLPDHDGLPGRGSRLLRLQHLGVTSSYQGGH